MFLIPSVVSRRIIVFIKQITSLIISTFDSFQSFNLIFTITRMLSRIVSNSTVGKFNSNLLSLDKASTRVFH